MYYNTTKESGVRLETYRTQAATQDLRIATFFEMNPGEVFTPWEVQSLVFNIPAPPITSVRRSMSSLTKAGILTKTTTLKEAGRYDRRSHAWTLNERYRETLGVMDRIFDPQEPTGGPQDHIYAEVTNTITEGRKPENKPLLEPLLFDLPPVRTFGPDGEVICCICGRELTDPVSIKHGMGAVCRAKQDLEQDPGH